MKYSCMQVMVHIAQKLEQLHDAGWVHRDLEAGNAIWLPSCNQWTLIDFGSAAQTGAPHSCGSCLATHSCRDQVHSAFL
jgi:serine/threonine protein kinase